MEAPCDYTFVDVGDGLSAEMVRSSNKLRTKLGFMRLLMLCVGLRPKSPGELIISTSFWTFWQRSWSFSLLSGKRSHAWHVYMHIQPQ